MRFVSILLLAAITFLTSCALNGRTQTAQSYNARLKGFEYPFKIQTYSLKSQGQNLDLSYMDVSPQNKKVAVLFHGKNFAGYYWEPIIKDLSKKGYRSIVIDQIGFGKSSKPKKYQHSFAQMALNTKKLLDELGLDKYNLVGHSMGGMLGVTMAYMFSDNIEKLVLVNPIGLETYLDHAEFKDIDFFYKRELSKTKEKVIAYQKKNYYAGEWNEKYEKILEPTFGQLKGSDWATVAWSNALTYGPIFYEDSLARFSKLKVPTILILGTRDHTGPGRGWKKPGSRHKFGRYDLFAGRLKKLLPAAKVIELKGMGHMPQYENYSKFSKAFYPEF